MGSSRTRIRKPRELQQHQFADDREHDRLRREQYQLGRDRQLRQGSARGQWRQHFCGGTETSVYSNCTIENTYINNLAPGDGAHQNPILLDGGSNDTVAHNTVHCVTGNDCTSELTLEEDDGDQVNETVTQNLLMAAGHQAAYCAYPGPFRSAAKYQVSGITWEDNVIQKGANGHCDASYGEVYGWYPSTCSPNPCTWTGNVYDDGTVWNP